MINTHRERGWIWAGKDKARRSPAEFARFRVCERPFRGAWSKTALACREMGELLYGSTILGQTTRMRGSMHAPRDRSVDSSMKDGIIRTSHFAASLPEWPPFLRPPRAARRGLRPAPTCAHVRVLVFAPYSLYARAFGQVLVSGHRRYELFGAPCKAPKIHIR